MEFYEQVEQSIRKKYRREIWLRFIQSIKDYELIKAGDRIAVCISGGKDSMCMAKCFQQLVPHSEVPFTAEYLVMDPGYNAANRRRILDNAEALHVPIHLFETKIFDIVADVEHSPCYLCARMRRGYLYKKAQELGCNKIALAHHFDDAIETVLLSMLYSGEIKTMMPKLHSAHYPGMELIRPMYLVREADIIAWRQYNGLQFIQCACRFTENCALSDGGGSKRLEMKKLIRTFRQASPPIDMNIFRSVHNVDLGAVIGWRKHGERHSFLDDYDA
ncbi:tRNA 2-thiocytidine(32) synthetase TtcA [Ethanoligenens harbinense]|uniref:PP-loop domain protein n=1 Tax=Ethanoligenens harbinense (strain DSM 18485 / JCM 12961 / CGMCC 1.5033 / YUAN-3) TaxID=663278 RepID=E6U483_ETHHY|nr:tRNA 2-thiocytidine(32) synthetase TtcA [Ethanoligenens harbinense]ADU26583.1 PP-loop domain protein [Ethanoligenens harbinense YUAN-3]AVQ95709.1 tRNA 2-thiocytidine(32) synthetase TtcA [Ethanoligenens harbinense YUAN-3]AYF38372.1 tRNA 2-thiocytidine(32) synthetase TtcA [Ethanoligenens harbinense]AYF41116.1 tRNA 2-thiocytidine(32) synthetase TtcA [Ethanoligenens harbinense]QCN91948.1 tRNA 2-thiocytidine(32) synthetase TtcA [Ethanoligenens harbinense]